MAKKVKLTKKQKELAKVQLALLALFADLDMVFTEDDALTAEKRKISLGRCYESWKRCRSVLDPEFDPSKHVRPRQYGSIRKGLSRRATV